MALEVRVDSPGDILAADDLQEGYLLLKSCITAWICRPALRELAPSVTAIASGYNNQRAAV